MTKIKVITTVAAWPETLEVTRNLLKKHLAEDFELIAFVDTPEKKSAFNLWDAKLRERAFETAQTVCERAYLIPEKSHKNRREIFPDTKEKKAKNANTRAADTLQTAWNLEIHRSEKPVMILDNDMFPIADFSFYEKLNLHSIRGVVNTSKDPNSEKRIDWIWSGLLYINPSKMQSKDIWSFDCGEVDGIPVDVSGQSHHWLAKHRNTTEGLTVLKHLASCHWRISDSPIKISDSLSMFINSDDRNVDGNIFCELYDETFLHFRAGSNWRIEKPDVVINRNSKFLEALIDHAKN
jgi:hypothetical protein